MKRAALILVAALAFPAALAAQTTVDQKRPAAPDASVSIENSAGSTKVTGWERAEVSVCLQHPGFDVDLEVRADTATLYRVYLGRAGLAGAMRTQQLTMTGPRALQRGFGRWFAWSAFALASRLAEQRRTAASRRFPCPSFWA